MPGSHPPTLRGFCYWGAHPLPTHRDQIPTCRDSGLPQKDFEIVSKPSPTATPSPRSTPTETPAATATPSPSATPTFTSTPFPTATATPVATATPSPSAAPIPTITPFPTPTATPVATATPSPSVTQTSTSTPEPPCKVFFGQLSYEGQLPTRPGPEDLTLHAAVLLSDGTVLVTGGISRRVNRLPSSEVYDPSTGAWYSTGSMTVGRASHKVTLLQDGRVLVAGGSGERGHSTQPRYMIRRPEPGLRLAV